MKRLPSFLITILSAMLQSQSLPQDGVSGIVQAFQHYPVVAVGEIHSIQQAGDFYDSLVRNPDFQQTVNDIVIEFASRRSQPILDRYINGEDVSADDLRQVWENTTKVFAFESPIYPISWRPSARLTLICHRRKGCVSWPAILGLTGQR